MKIRKWMFFQHFAAELRKKCLIMQGLWIRWPHTVEDILEYYKKDKALLSSKLYVQFNGERGDHLNGFIREFFQHFGPILGVR